MRGPDAKMEAAAELAEAELEEIRDEAVLCELVQAFLMKEAHGHRSTCSCVACRGLDVVNGRV